MNVLVGLWSFIKDRKRYVCIVYPKTAYFRNKEKNVVYVGFELLNFFKN